MESGKEIQAQSGASSGGRRGQVEIIVAAFAFAISVPANKLLLADISPLALSGTLYLSAGILCAVLVWVHGRAIPDGKRRNRVRGREWLWLGAAILFGAVIAPLLLLLGLNRVSGYTAGLLLNSEAAFTVALAVVLSGERVGRFGWMGALAVVSGAAILSVLHRTNMPASTNWAGIAFVVGACACWGIDNNLLQRVSLRDAREIAAVKGMTGGIVSLLLAAAFGGFGQWSVLTLLAAVSVGALSFGVSIVLFVRGLRRLGVLQAGTLFALAPGFAAILSWIFLHERLDAFGILALVFMSLGALLLIKDRHEHLHLHEEIEHEHEHRHDLHHRHAHPEGNEGPEPHSHVHTHDPLMHGHRHLHDVHHRHSH
ncbi:MAG: DMT family transporter [Candidatus Eisenbacteria bacterium]|nr:DMT family transporter [Candidatus Eisenbacteria bacterium]